MSDKPKVRKGAEWLVTVNYTIANREKGDIYSQHKTYDAARASARKSGFDSHLAIVAASGYRQVGF